MARHRSGIQLARLAVLTGLLCVPSTISGCNDAQAGSLIGAGGGALAGQAIGGNTEGTLIGAGVGAVAGYIIGNESDKSKQGRYDPDRDY